MNPIVLAPTSMANAQPLEYIDAASTARYDGIGIRPLNELLDAMLAGLPFSREHHHRDDRDTTLAGATRALDGTKRFLRRY